MAVVDIVAALAAVIAISVVLHCLMVWHMRFRKQSQGTSELLNAALVSGFALSSSAKLFLVSSLAFAAVVQTFALSAGVILLCRMLLTEYSAFKQRRWQKRLATTVLLPVSYPQQPFWSQP